MILTLKRHVATVTYWALWGCFILSAIVVVTMPIYLAIEGAPILFLKSYFYFLGSLVLRVLAGGLVVAVVAGLVTGILALYDWASRNRH